MGFDELPDEEDRAPAEAPFRSKMGEIVLMTDHIPSRAEILDAKKQQLREAGML